MKEKLLTALENSRNYTMAVAKALPENDYDIKLIKDSWQFNDLITHIGYGIIWWDSNIIKNTETDWAPPKTPATKKGVIDYVSEAYDQLKTTLQNIDITDDAVIAFNSTMDHITHHRGQAVLFLRNNDINPPEYAY